MFICSKKLAAKVSAASGLAKLKEEDFPGAARKFLTMPGKMEDGDLIAAEDVAVYGGLCALASFNRKELKSELLSNSAFKSLLELVPRIREVLNCFYSAEYSTVFESLDGLRMELLLDIHLHPHVEKLFKQIRNRAIVSKYFPQKWV